LCVPHVLSNLRKDEDVNTLEKLMSTVADPCCVRRALTLSTASAPRRRAQDLHHDAERDLRALGCHIPVINNCQSLDLAKDASSCGEGVLFMRAPPTLNLASTSLPGGVVQGDMAAYCRPPLVVSCVRCDREQTRNCSAHDPTLP